MKTAMFELGGIALFLKLDTQGIKINFQIKENKVFIDGIFFNLFKEEINVKPLFLYRRRSASNSS